MSRFVPVGGRDPSLRVIIPPHLERRFRELRANCYAAIGPVECIQAILSVMEESAKALEEYRWSAVETLVLPAFAAARDGYVATVDYCKRTGLEAKALEDLHATWLEIEQLKKETEGMSGSFELAKN